MTGLPSKPATALPMSGLSWLAVEPTASFLSGGDHEPGPAGAEAGGGGLAEFLLELVEASRTSAAIAAASVPFGAPPLPGPRIFQKKEWLLWPPALLRRPVADRLGHLAQVGDQRVDGERGEGRMVLQEVVGVVDVGLVVLRVMDFHRPRIDVGLEGVVGVGQFGKFVGHGFDRFGFRGKWAGNRRVGRAVHDANAPETAKVKSVVLPCALQPEKRLQQLPAFLLQDASGR